INVAVPPLQHSGILGQCASSHTVTKPNSFRVCLTPLNSSVSVSFIPNHSGLFLLITILIYLSIVLLLLLLLVSCLFLFPVFPSLKSLYHIGNHKGGFSEKKLNPC